MPQLRCHRGARYVRAMNAATTSPSAIPPSATDCATATAATTPLRRTIDVYVRPLEEDLGKIATAIDGAIAGTKVPDGLSVTLRGMVQGMRASFTSFAEGLCLALVLLYLILVAQFQSFVDPFLILIAVPPGLAGVI